MNGARIGGGIIAAILKRIHVALRPALNVCFVAAAGATLRGSRACRTVSATRLTFATTVSASA